MERELDITVIIVRLDHFLGGPRLTTTTTAGRQSFFLTFLFIICLNVKRVERRNRKQQSGKRLYVTEARGRTAWRDGLGIFQREFRRQRGSNLAIPGQG